MQYVKNGKPKHKKPHLSMRFSGNTFVPLILSWSDQVGELTLTCLEPALSLVDHVDATFTTYDPAITVPVLQRAERVLDLHGRLLFLRREPAPGLAGHPSLEPEQ